MKERERERKREREGETSLAGEGKLDGIAASATEGVYNEVTTTPLGQVLCNLLGCGTEPALCRVSRSSWHDDVMVMSYLCPDRLQRRRERRDGIAGSNTWPAGQRERDGGVAAAQPGGGAVQHTHQSLPAPGSPLPFPHSLPSHSPPLHSRPLLCVCVCVCERVENGTLPNNHIAR